MCSLVIGNYDYTTFASRVAYSRQDLSSRFGHSKQLEPFEIAGVSLQDCGVDLNLASSRRQLTVPRIRDFSFSTGYNYNWVDSALWSTILQ